MSSDKKEFSYVFIHGFESTGDGNKPKKFRKTLINFKTDSKCEVYLNSPTLWEKEEEFESTNFATMFAKVSNAVKDAALHGNNVILMGSSFGGLLVTRFMQTKQPGSELVAACCLLSPALHFTDVLTDPETGSNFFRRMVIGSRDSSKEGHPKFMAEWEEKGFIRVEYLKFINWRDVDFKWASFADFRSHVECIDGVGLGVPTYVLHSKTDNVIPFKYTDDWVNGLPDEDRKMVTYKLIPMGDHTLYDVADLEDMVIEWIRSTF